MESVLKFRFAVGLPLVAVLAPLVIFLLLAVPRLDLPGLHYDEALEGGLPAVQVLNGQPVAALNGIALHLGRRTLPLMVQNHIGAAQVYAALPFVLWGGPHASSLRAMTVVAGLLTILATYLFVAQLHGRLAAFWTSMWLAAFASFVFWSRQGVFVTSLASCFAMWALATGAYWWRTGRTWAIGLAGLCLGLAVYSKLNALWLLNGLWLWAVVSHADALLQHARMGRRRAPATVHHHLWQGGQRRPWPFANRRSWQPLLTGGIGLLLGMGPLIVYNLLSRGATFRVIQASATETYLGQNNTAVLHNLRVRVAQVADVLRSGDHLWYLGGAFRNYMALLGVLVALLVLIAASLRRSEHAPWRRTLLVPFLALAVVAQSCFTISALWPTHFAVAAPLPAIIFGAGSAQAYGWFTGRGRAKLLGRALVIAFVVVVVASQLLTSWRYLQVVTRTGGLSFHSASIYELSRFLEDRPERAVALDWGIATQVGYLSGGRSMVEELYSFQPDRQQFGEALRQRFNRDDLYITHATNQEAFPHRALFLEIVANDGKWAERVHTIMGSNGWAELEVWRVRQP